MAQVFEIRPAERRPRRPLAPASTTRGAILAILRTFPLIAIAYGLYLTGYHSKRAAGRPDPRQLQNVPPPDPLSRDALRPVPKPARAPAAAQISVPSPKHATTTAAKPLAPSARGFLPVTYVATRKKILGGCTGELELTRSMLLFRCPGKAGLVLPIAAIAQAHKDGVVLKSGEKYHFELADRTRGDVESIFASWLQQVQRQP